MSSLASTIVTTMSENIQIHRTIQSIRSIRNKIPPSAKVGFVPTMGALHEGHLSLVKKAREENDIMIASVFVNPKQFGKNEDFGTYPRQLERDAELLEQNGVDHVFAPNADEQMYGENHITYVDPVGFEDNVEEGKCRPGFFKGVATVVTKLFNIVQPTNAYFGQKDAAQCVLIKRIVDDLNIPVNVHIMDTIREHDGLAMSSRNAYLSPEERKVAPIVYQSLNAARELFHAKIVSSNTSTSISSKEFIDCTTEILKSEPLVSEIQYIAIDDKETMKPLTHVDQSGAIVSLACKVGAVRLIDNIVL